MKNDLVRWNDKENSPIESGLMWQNKNKILEIDTYLHDGRLFEGMLVNYFIIFNVQIIYS